MRAPHLPVEGALAFLPVHDVFTFVSFAVRPLEHSVAMHLVILPAAVVITSVLPLVPARAAYIVLLKVAHIGIAVAPEESARALLFTISVVSLELRAIGPAFEPLSMLLVVFPEASVIAAIFVDVVAEAMSFVPQELALINVSVCMDEAAEEAP